MKTEDFDVSAIAALAPGTAVHAKGKQRVRDIIFVATSVLAFDGYSAFTMRTVAARLGVSLRNVQYYFPTKNDLFRAVVEEMLRKEIRTALRVVQRAELSDVERFKEFVDYSLRDNQDTLVRGFQFELWALATRDQFAARCRDRMTKAYCQFILRLVKPLTPRLTVPEQRKKAAMILALLQGLPLILGKGVRLDFPLGDLQHTLRDEVLAVVRVGS
ncbi:MAG: TetR/AcrR family transcriptional regulator [Thermomicrobiales bacterium]|nr:TetR/AcrR family transcriptional regulator [Thermomicrobiales bacterium]